MRFLKKWIMIAGMASPRAPGADCAPGFREAAVGGAIDYVSDTKAAILASLLRWDQPFAGG